MMMTFITQRGESQGKTKLTGRNYICFSRFVRSFCVELTVGFIVIPRCEMRESEMQCFLDTRALKQASHQSKSLTKASKPPNSKYLLLVEVQRAESLVDEVVGPLLTVVAGERVEVGGVEGVIPAVRGPVVT